MAWFDFDSPLSFEFQLLESPYLCPFLFMFGSLGDACTISHCVDDVKLDLNSPDSSSFESVSAGHSRFRFANCNFKLHGLKH